MAISSTYEQMKSQFNSQLWESIDLFERYYLKRIAETRHEPHYYTDKLGNRIKYDAVNNFPKLKRYEVWAEGYSVTGNQSGANFIGKTLARNFSQACHILMCEKYLKNVKKMNNPLNDNYETPGLWAYNPRDLTDWACKLHWSKELAMKTFG